MKSIICLAVLLLVAQAICGEESGTHSVDRKDSSQPNLLAAFGDNLKNIMNPGGQGIGNIFSGIVKGVANLVFGILSAISSFLGPNGPFGSFLGPNGPFGSISGGDQSAVSAGDSA